MTPRSSTAAVPNAETSEADPTRAQLEAEVQSLRARLASLETELVDVQAKANDAVAHWQERAYWLDRWHVDLNALMERPGAAQLRGGLRAVRTVARLFKRLKHRFLS